jgi:hypothetical protein
VDSYERLTILILDGLNQVLSRSDSFVSLDDRNLITAEIAARLRNAGVTAPPPAATARDLGPFAEIAAEPSCVHGVLAKTCSRCPGPALGSDGDTRDWTP